MNSPVRTKGPTRVGYAKYRVRRQRVQPAGALNVGKPRRPGRHEAIGDAEFPAERDALGFLREDGIRSTVDDEIAHVFAHDDAAGPRRAFEKDERPALFLQLEGGAEPGDAAANDDDVDDVDGVDRVRHASAPDDRLERGDERRRRVQRFRAAQCGACVTRRVRRLDVDVEQDFGVIAHESDGHDQERTLPFGGSRSNELTEVWTDPRLGRPAGALVGDLVLRDARQRGHALGGRGNLVRVHVAALDHARRKAVGREDHRFFRTRSGVADAFGERLQQQRMRVKRPDRLEDDAGGQRGGRRVHVLLHAQCRELRRKRKTDDAIDVPRRELIHRLLDVRMPVPHPDDDGDFRAEPFGERVGLRQRDVGQGRAAADGVVVVRHLLDEFRRRRPSAAHNFQIFGHLRQRRRSTMGHQEHCRARIVLAVQQVSTSRR